MTELKYIAAAIAGLPLAAVALGLGKLFSTGVEAMGRNPAAGEQIKGFTFIVFAFLESIGLFALLIALLILFL